MSVAVRPNTIKQKHATATHTGATSPRRHQSSGQLTVVESITRPDPQWLPWVIACKKMTQPVALISLASVLLIYGINAVMERQWGTNFQALEAINNERNALITQTERQKYQLPRNIEVANNGYVELKQDRVLFVKPAPSRPFTPKTQSQRKSLLREDRLPVGY